MSFPSHREKPTAVTKRHYKFTVGIALVIYGELAQGIGLALSEDFEDIAKDRNISSCGVPYIRDVPDALELHYIETPRENGPFGAAGCGELPLTSPHASIINAIHCATDAWITHLPATPERVKKALDELK